MSYIRAKSNVDPAPPVPEAGEAKTPTDAVAGPQEVQQAQDSYPRIVEEHHVLGPEGEDEIEAIDDQGRRWYHLRPDPRGRADVLGINRTWWTVLAIVLLVIVFLPW
jgi:hypothetical protein